MSLPAILSAAEPLADGFRAAIPESWHQGRTAYGGLSSALALSAARGLDPALPPLRSAQISMIAPVAGLVDVRARVMRRGRNACWVSAEIAGEGGIGLAATFVFMGPVESSALHVNQCALPQGLIPVGEAHALSQERGITFLRHHFEVRFALPKSTARHPEMCWWVRARDREGLDPQLEPLLLGDCLPPGVMPLLGPGVPVSTMQWQCNLLTPAPTTQDGWWLLRSRGDYAENGCASQRMDMWNADGAPVMASMQSVALFG